MGDLNLTTRLQAGKAISADQINGLVTNATVKPLPISRIDNLQPVLDGKTDKGHIHAMTSVSGLMETLEGKSDSRHVHTIGHVTGLQEALNEKAKAIDLPTKANLVHTHEASEINHLNEAMSGKANVSHVHEIAHINGLQQALSQLQASISQLQSERAHNSHTHANYEARMQQLQEGINAKAQATHTHHHSQIQGLGSAATRNVAVVENLGGQPHNLITVGHFYELLPRTGDGGGG